MPQKSSIVRYLIAAGICLAALIANAVSLTAAPSNLQWSRPQRIPGYKNESGAPFLVADRDRRVHAFNSQQFGSQIEITYSQWVAGQKWTTPMDIVRSPRAQQATRPSVVLDAAGIFHMVFVGGNEQGADIYYTQAFAAEAASSTAWTKPDPIGPNAGPVFSSVILQDGKNNLFVIYAGGREGLGVYSVSSHDGGSTWSSPTVVFLTEDDAIWCYGIAATFDQQGRLHAVWTTFDQSGTGREIYYARLEPDRIEWSVPLVLARYKGFSIGATSIVAQGNDVIIIYEDVIPEGAVPTRWMRHSSDAGRSWSVPIRPFLHTGSYGPVALVIDGNDVLHMLTGNRVGNPPIHGLWHSTWDGTRWSDLEPVTSGTRIVSLVGLDGFDPSSPRAVVSQGNVLLVTWTTDPGAGLNGVWYSYATLGVPELAVAPLPTASNSPTPKVTMAVPAPTPTHAITVPAGLGGSEIPTGSLATGGSSGILFGVVPVLLILLPIIVVRLARRM